MSSVSIFMYFEKTEIETNLFSRIVPYTFAVFLLTDNFFLRSIINKDIIAFGEMPDNIIVLIIMVLYALLLMCICILIDYIRKRIFDEKVTKFLCVKMERMWDKSKLVMIQKDMKKE